MIRRNLTTSEIWSYYWKKQNEKNSKKVLTNKRKQFIINIRKGKNKLNKKIKKIKKVVDKPFQICYNKYVKKTKNNFKKERGNNYGKQNYKKRNYQCNVK